MLESLLVKENIVHLGAALYVAGFLFRDQLLLRLSVIVADIVYILYFYLAPEVPLWGGIFWSGVLVLINVWMVFRILIDRTHYHMGEEGRRLFGLLATLTPGEFRQLMRAGCWQTATTATVLTEEHVPPDRLYYVLDGEIVVDKSGHRAALAPETFIGEVSFLLRRPASATVTVSAGARYVAWDLAALRRTLLRAPSLAVALAATLNADMALKVARA